MRSAKRKCKPCNIKNTSGKLRLHHFMNMNSSCQPQLHLFFPCILSLKSKRKQVILIHLTHGFLFAFDWFFSFLYYFFSIGIWMSQFDHILTQGQQETDSYDEPQGPAEIISGTKARSLPILKLTLRAARYISYHWSPFRFFSF